MAGGRVLRLVMVLMVVSVLAAGWGDAASGADAASEAPEGGAVSTVAPPDAVMALRFEAAELARDRGIPLSRAEQRMQWQQEVPELVRDAESHLGDDRFGGVWVDSAGGDRVKVAVTRDATKADHNAVAEAASDHGITEAVDVVSVKYGESELRSVLDRLADSVADVHVDSASPVSVGLRPDRNAVVLHLPPTAETAVPDTLVELVEQAESYGDRVQIRFDAAPVETQACVYNVYCDPPLRAGIRVHNDQGWWCSAAFVARSRSTGALYQFTAGHCVHEPAQGGTWWSRFSDGSKHVIGPVHNHRFDVRGDAGIFRVSNPSGWDAKAWVLVTAGPDTGAGNFAYRIKQDARSVVGQRVCISGASSAQSDCGKVLEVDVTAAYPQGAVSGLVVADYCAIPGDSGAPVYATHTAYGIHSGTYGACRTLYQDVQTAEDLMNVNVAHG